MSALCEVYPFQVSNQAGQEFIWQKRRQEIPPSTIARELEVSRALVSKTQRIAEERVERILLHSASANRIKIRSISPRYGFAVGYCAGKQIGHVHCILSCHGTQLWFNHRGNCENCSEKQVCYELLHTLAEEWNLPLPEGLPATEAGEVLFNLIMRRLKWIE